MSLRIQNNVEAFNAHRQLNATASKVSKAMERLSSGYRINRAADDAAGLGISEKMRGQIRGLAQAQKNIGDGISMVQTAEGNLDEVHKMLQRVRELAVQYKNGSLSTTAQNAIQSEVNQLVEEMGRIARQAEFNGTKLLDGTAGATGSVTFQVGANDTDTISTSFASLTGAIDTAVSGTDFTWTAGSATFSLASATAIADLDSAIGAVSASRASFGAVQNRLEYALGTTSAYQENLVAAESRIRDVDMAEEMVSLTKAQILQQAGTAMLAQANAGPQAVLSLLQ